MDNSVKQPAVASKQAEVKLGHVGTQKCDAPEGEQEVGVVRPAAEDPAVSFNASKSQVNMNGVAMTIANSNSDATVAGNGLELETMVGSARVTARENMLGAQTVVTLKDKSAVFCTVLNAFSTCKMDILRLKKPE